MSKEKCMKCREATDNSLPICTKCRMEFKDSIDPKTKEEIDGFQKLADFLNGFEGDRDDLIWLIKDEIADRQSLIISNCKIVNDIERGLLHLEAPDGNAFAKKRVEEIGKLYKALAIVKKHYGG